jgi:hypothetical protein
VNSAVCADPHKITWPALPVVVGMGPDISPDYDSSVSDAMGFWNDSLDFTAFTTSGPKTQVHVEIGSANDKGDGATSFYYDEDGDLNALVEIRQPGDVTEVYYIVAHELGHSLGLVHDPDDFISVMYPKLDFKWDGVDQSGEPVDFRTIVVTDNDQNALRAAYR